MLQDPLRSGALLLAFAGAALLAPAPCASADFIRGDVDKSGRLEVTDAIIYLRGLFRVEPDLIACRDAADVDDDGSLTITDAIALLVGLFQGGPPPAEPFPECGPDPTGDELSCEAHAACEVTLEFFGVPLSADAVFFVIDRSPQSGPNNLVRAKEEVLRALDALPGETLFAIVFFDVGVFAFPPDAVPAAADSVSKAAARAFVDSMARGGGTCPDAGLLRALEYVAPSAKRPVLLHATDGRGTCRGRDQATYLQSLVDEVTAANGGRARIFTFGLSVDCDPCRQHLEDLAARNGGVFTDVP